MTPDERRLLVERQVGKALHFLSQADEMMQVRHFDMAANRYYYACFHVVQALFIQREISGHTHTGMITQFSKYFVKTEMVSIEDGSLLARLFQLRQKADYNCAYDVSEEEVQSLEGPVKRFVNNIIILITNYKDIE